jgi:hypothetical protein
MSESTTNSSVVDAARRLCDRALGLALEEDQRARIIAARDRLDGPLRVAIAGRIKAGKSTLLNALIGERVAPTDAGECTRIVSWYRQGIRYSVTAQLEDGGVRPLEFHRNGELSIELGELRPEEVTRLVIDWPSERLTTTTLIDTPGLSSLDRTVSQRTRDALAADGHGTPDADAVVYLMRHLHRTDADFLDGFVAGSDMGASPVNSIAVLSRADEVGAGRLDAMESARSVARAYERDGRLSALTSSVVAVAGLVAETAQTLTEREYVALKSLAGLPDDLVTALLRSVDRVASYEVDRIEAECGVSPEARFALVERLGLFGVRFAIERIRTGRVTSSGQLAAALLVASGLDDLRDALDRRIRPRAAVLQARSALLVLAGVVDELDEHDPDAARRFARELDEAASAAHEFTELRLAHVASSGLTLLGDIDVDRALQLTAPASLTDRLGLRPDLDEASRREAVLAEIGHWRTLAANPSHDPLTVEACEIAARCAEGLFVQL